MADFVIAAPVWGDAYVRRFLEAALPSHRAALAHAGMEGRWIIHTDRPDMLGAAMAGLDVEFPTVPASGDRYQRFGDAHRAALNAAQPGDRVALLTADIVVSREAFGASAARFEQGKRAVVCCGTRTLSRDFPPVGAAAPALLDWTMANTHPMCRGCFWPLPSDAWPTGHTNVPWAVYFRRDERIILRGLHLHPIAILKGGDTPFTGTLDQDLLDNFPRSEIHVVTDRHELAMAEISPADRDPACRARPMSIERIVQWAATRTGPTHRWLSTHRIVIQGDDGPTVDLEVWPRVLELLG